jgi:hypothetical protein
LAAAGAYKDDLKYQLYPQPGSDGYNSNSLTSGVLSEAGVTTGFLLWLMFAIQDVTGLNPVGFDKPIPYDSKPAPATSSTTETTPSDPGTSIERNGHWINMLTASAFR